MSKNEEQQKAAQQQMEEQQARQQEEQARAAADAQKSQQSDAPKGARRGETVVPKQAPAPEQPPEEQKQKVQVRSMTGQARVRGGQSLTGDWQEVEVTAQQLAELRADDQVQVAPAGVDPSQAVAGSEGPRNVMHAAFDPALAALHPDKIKAMAMGGAAQRPADQLAQQRAPGPGNPTAQGVNAASAGPQAGIAGATEESKGTPPEESGTLTNEQLAARRGAQGNVLPTPSQPPPKNR